MSDPIDSLEMWQQIISLMQVIVADHISSEPDPSIDELLEEWNQRNPIRFSMRAENGLLFSLKVVPLVHQTEAESEE